MLTQFNYMGWCRPQSKLAAYARTHARSRAGWKMFHSPREGHNRWDLVRLHQHLPAEA